MKKRGQFTLFVVLGVVLLLVVGAVMYYNGNLSSVYSSLSGGVSLPSQVQEVADHVQECVDTSAYEAVVNIGYTGGYYSLPALSYIDSNLSYVVPYYLYDGVDSSLSSDALSSELNAYISSLVTSCVYFEQFSSFTITSGEISVDSTIDQNVVSVEVSYPLVVGVDQESYTLSDPYTTEVSANLGWLHDIAQQIVVYDIANPDTIDYTNLLSYGVSNILVAPVSNDTYVYVLQDTSSGIGNYSFFFAEYSSTLVSDDECVLDLDCSDGFVCTDGACEEEE